MQPLLVQHPHSGAVCAARHCLRSWWRFLGRTEQGSSWGGSSVPSQTAVLLEEQGRAEEAAQTKPRQREVSFLTVQLGFLLKRESTSTRARMRREERHLLIQPRPYKRLSVLLSLCHIDMPFPGQRNNKFPSLHFPHRIQALELGSLHFGI